MTSEEQPTAFEKAHAIMVDALASLERGRLEDALASVQSVRSLLETEQQFRDARRASA